jgi:hypothetical protein
LATQTERPELQRESAPALSGPVPALLRLAHDVNGSQIRWCSWKSNAHLAKALEGRTDLDVLVHPEDASAFRMALARHDLRPLMPAPTREHPGMEHHLGMDPDTGRLYHLHVHTELVLGEQHVKNHRIAMEEALLLTAASTPDAPVPVPAPALELAILAARALLKYRARDIVKDVLAIRSPGLKDEVRAELAWLLQRTSVAEVRRMLVAAGEPLPTSVIATFLETYARDPRAGREFWRLRSKLRRALASRRRIGVVRARLRALRIGLTERRHGARMTPAAGGLTVAFVGSDGSGKSTVAAETARWLDWKVATHVTYLGSKSPSRRSRWSYTLFRALRRTARGAAARFGERSLPARWIGGVRDVTLAVHEFAIAGDRERRCMQGRAAAARGQVVLFDRFPMDALSTATEHRVLDGPRIARVLPDGGRLVRRIGRNEERRYAGLGLPDVLIFLLVDPAVAAARKPDHLPEVLAAKTRAAEELWELASRPGVIATRSFRVAAEMPLPDVLVAVRRAIWSVL